MNKPLGTARWADPEEVIEHHEFVDGSVWLGRSPTEDETAIGFADDRHVCLVSGSRAGKGTSVIVNNLALWPGSLVVIDPKGENATVTAARRGPGSQYCKGLGQAVHVLDPFNAATVPDALRSRFNPLDALDVTREETIDEAGRIADALVVTNPEAKDPFWDESARAMVKGLILHVLTEEEFEGRRNLVTIRDLVTRGDAEKVALLKEMGEADVPSAHALLWEGASHNASFGGVIMRIGASFAEMYSNSPKQYESVRQVADRNTEFVDSPGMKRCLEASDFALSELKTKPEGMSIFLSLPQRYMSTHFRWLRMMIALTLTEMEATPGRPATGYRVLFCLDEFAGLKRMEVIENAVSQIAGYGVKLMFVLQSLEQLKGTYKEKWETFLSNCGLKIFFGLEEYFSREYVSKFIGEMEVIRSGRSSSEARGTTEGTSESVTYGQSVSMNEQMSYSKSSTYTKSKGENSSTAKGWNRGRAKGSNWGLNLGHNSSDSSTWKPHLLFGRGDERLSDGGGWSQGGNYGRNKGINEGINSTFTTGRNTGESIAEGTSQSYSQGFSVSENISESRSTSQSKSHTSTEGTNESVHKRRLINEDEIGLLFQRLTDKRHPAYPGLALVLAAGEEPIFLRKVNYFEDPQFINCYDPHPDHLPFRPLIEHVVRLNGPGQKLLEALNRRTSKPFNISQVLAEPGMKVRAGEPLVQIEGEALGKRTALIHGPVTGRVTDLAVTQGEALSLGELASVTYYGDAQPEEYPYRDLEALAAAIEVDWQRAQKPPELPPPSLSIPPPPRRNWALIAGMVILPLLGILLFIGPRQSSSDRPPTPARRPPDPPKAAPAIRPPTPQSKPVERILPPVQPASLKPKEVERAAAVMRPQRISSGAIKDNLIERVRPVYPDIARKARISGVVELEAVIDRDGRVKTLTTLSGPPFLVDAAREAVRQWRYKPYLLNGEPVEVMTNVSVNFALNPQ